MSPIVKQESGKAAEEIDRRWGKQNVRKRV
jgi:hypothetical protein